MQSEASYRAHDSHLARHLTDPELQRLAESWMRTDTVDHWRHKRMLGSIQPLLDCYPGSSWLTVGDGRWGREARYIIDRGGRALATDICEALLKEGRERQYIPQYQVENAERLTLADSSFDFVLCKESYHHFPRPAVALYEMLRVARKAVILIEPQDEYPARLLTRLKILIKRSTGRKVERGYHAFEDSGNYVYTISKRELTKVALGIGLTHVGFKAMNSYYIAGVEYEKLTRHSSAYYKIRLMILLQDICTTIGVAHAGLLAGILFKGVPDASLTESLRAAGFEIVTLPRNPYLGAEVS